MIPLQRLLTSYTERDLDCQLCLAEQSGWSKTESAKALREPACAHLFSDEEGHKTDANILSAHITKH